MIETNNIHLHYLDYAPHNSQILILLHGLTANAHCFDGLINAGLSQNLRVISVDLRGRGLSDKPDHGYSMEDHARDILGLMDTLGLSQAVIGGHSFGGLVSLYLAAHYPERVKKLVIMDAGLMHPTVRDLINPSLDRLGKPLPSLDAYIRAMKNTPYYYDGFWDEQLEGYYRADMEILPDGQARARSRPEAIAEAIDQVLATDWDKILAAVQQPTILLHAPEGFGPPGTLPVITEEKAQSTVQSLRNCRYARMTGHHITMLFGKHAAKTVKVITDFVRE